MLTRSNSTGVESALQKFRETRDILVYLARARIEERKVIVGAFDSELNLKVLRAITSLLLHRPGPTMVDTSAVVLESVVVEEPPVVLESLKGAAVGDGAGAGDAATPGVDEVGPGAEEPEQNGRPFSPQMKSPHISTLYEKQDVMVKHFGVTQKQALRTQALLRLGVTDEDVRIAERLMGSRSEGADNTPSKEEWLLGVTYAQMSFHKALQVLGISEAVVEEERSRRLGELGSGGSGGASECGAGQEAEDTCGRFFIKKRRSSIEELGTTLPGEVAFANSRVLQLEEVCHTQMTRIQELESQLAVLSARSSTSDS